MQFIYILGEKSYYDYISRGLVKYIPKRCIPSKKVKILEYIKDGNDEVIGKVCGIFLNTSFVDREELLIELIKAIEKIKDQNINSIVFEDLSLFSLKDLQFLEDNTNLKITNGLKVVIFFLPVVLKRIYEGLEEDLKEKEILIIGDEEDLTKEVIEYLSKHVGFITLAGEYESTIENISSYILNKTGLSIFYSKNVDKILTNYPIIINLKNDYQLNVDKLRKKALIFDFSIEKPLKKQLAGINSLACIHDFMFNIDQLNIRGGKFINSPIPSYLYEQFNFKSSDFNDLAGLSIRDKIYSIDNFVDYQIRRKGKL